MPALLEGLQELGRALLDFVYPPHCPSCGQAMDEAAEHLCQKCWDEILEAPPHRCERCSCPLTGQARPCAHCASWELVVERAVVLGPFQGAMQEAIHALKYRQQRPLGQVLGQRMGQEKALGRVLEELDFLVPVPLHPARQRERGYNQSLEIARGLAQALERPVLDGLVARRKNTRQQARLEADERRKNLQGAFIALDTVPREGLIGLVDDVLTTGATFNACAQALLEAGAQRVWAVALACPFPQRETPVSLDAIPSGN